MKEFYAFITFLNENFPDFLSCHETP